MEKPAKSLFDPANCAPKLLDTIHGAQMDGTRLSVALLMDEHGRICIPDRQEVRLHERHAIANWTAPPLQNLFRGSKAPPPNITQYPPDYVSLFYLVESHLLTACQAVGDLTDKELEDIYRALRRRPDGRSLGPVHDFLWQVAALGLAMQPTSQAEYEAVVGQLERSCRLWQWGLASRNYVVFLRRMIKKRHP